MATTLNNKNNQDRHKEFVRMVDELVQLKSCHKSQLALAGGFTPNNFFCYYNNTKSVSEKTLTRIKALYNTPINKSDTISTFIKEYREIKRTLDELKQQNAQLLQKLKEINDMLHMII